jgi:hypothetical protein
VLGGSQQAQNSEFEYWTEQNVSPSLRFVLATAGVTALSLCYTGQADSRSHIEEISRLVWNLNVQYLIHNSPSRRYKRSQLTLSHIISLKSVVIFYHLCLFLRIAVNKLNKQPRTADEGWSSSLGVGRGANNPSP